MPDSLAGLPAAATVYLTRWVVVPERVVASARATLIFGQRQGQPVALKLAEPGSEEVRAGSVLAAWQGRGAVRVLEQSGPALLLERLLPATPLLNLCRSGRDEEATDILAGVIRARGSVASPSTLPSIRDWGAGFERYARRGDAPLPATLVAAAAKTYGRLVDSQSPPLLLHGDLHHANVLYDAIRGWLAIDPKGVAGELAFETGAALRNPVELPALFADPAVVRRRVAQLAGRLGLAPQRILSWGFAQGILSALWSLEDDEPCPPDHAGLLLARTIRPMLEE